MQFSSVIIQWYSLNKRDLPWRFTKNPYYIWLSEIILQQTRVDQGLPYYLKFITEFPEIKDLANAPEDKVMKLWQGLGYYSRARNLHATAKIISSSYDGKFPENHSDIIKLKGIGEYTAAAICSFAFDLPYATVDGNVYRVLSRYFGMDTAIDSSQGKKDFLNLGNSLINKSQAGIYNQSIMEFGALQCIPVNPDCYQCPLQISCYALKNNLVKQLPVKSKKIKQRERHFNYLKINHGDTIYIKRRQFKDIWQNLYDFPLIETPVKSSPEELVKNKEWEFYFKNTRLSIGPVFTEEKHILSHQIIWASFLTITIDTKDDFFLQAPFLKIQQADLKNYPIPRLLEKHLEKH